MSDFFIIVTYRYTYHFIISIRLYYFLILLNNQSLAHLKNTRHFYFCFNSIIFIRPYGIMRTLLAVEYLSATDNLFVSFIIAQLSYYVNDVMSYGFNSYVCNIIKTIIFCLW